MNKLYRVLLWYVCPYYVSLINLESEECNGNKITYLIHRLMYLSANTGNCDHAIKQLKCPFHDNFSQKSLLIASQKSRYQSRDHVDFRGTYSTIEQMCANKSLPGKYTGTNLHCITDGIENGKVWLIFSKSHS